MVSMVNKWLSQEECFYKTLIYLRKIYFLLGRSSTVTSLKQPHTVNDVFTGALVVHLLDVLPVSLQAAKL